MVHAPAEKLFFTPEEAAVLLGWHPGTVRRKALRGELRYERSSPGRMSHIRIVAADVYRLAGQDAPAHEAIDAEVQNRRRLIHAVRVKMAELELLLADLEA